MTGGCDVCDEDLVIHNEETGDDLSCIVCGTDRGDVIHNIRETMESFLEISDELDSIRWMREVDYQEEPVPYGELDHDYHKHPFYIFCEYGHYICPECWLIKSHLAKGGELSLQPDQGDGSRYVYNAYTDPEPYVGRLDLRFYDEGSIDGDILREQLTEYYNDCLEKIPEDLTTVIEEQATKMDGDQVLLYEAPTVDHRDDYIRFIPSRDSLVQ